MEKINLDSTTLKSILNRVSYKIIFIFLSLVLQKRTFYWQIYNNKKKIYIYIYILVLLLLQPKNYITLIQSGNYLRFDDIWPYVYTVLMEIKHTRICICTSMLNQWPMYYVFSLITPNKLLLLLSIYVVCTIMIVLVIIIMIVDTSILCKQGTADKTPRVYKEQQIGTE